jgi:NADPH-dependent 2,4-dienoyl-CoA reductase/sulfur reductase-like enzyme
MSFPPEPFLHLAAGIKEVVKVPVLHAQNIKDPNQATRILEGGYVDMVGMTRAHIADPHLIAKIKMGQIDQIKQCVGANYCIDRQYQGLDVLCIQNAATSREYMGVPHIIEKTTGVKRKVVIVGGGPAGMEAARVAAERGHDVTLFEKQEQLGRPDHPGLQGTSARSDRRHHSLVPAGTARLGIDLRLGTGADEASILDLRPDIVVLANGGHPFLEQNEHWGADEGLVVSSWDVLSGKVARARTCWCTTPSANSPVCPQPTSSLTRAHRWRSSPTTSSRAWPSAAPASRPTTAACTRKKSS